MSLPSTPKTHRHGTSSTGLPSILRSDPGVTNSHSRAYSIDKATPQSQVRFSIPQGDETKPQPDSPSKIVYPNSTSTGIDNHGHLVDMNSGVMLDVPENIWKFHTNRKSHSRQKSLQAIIADTLAAINPEQQDTIATPGSQKSNISNVSPLNLRPNSVLYLAPESPMNSYKTPIPLQISLPPFLSPKNKQRKRSSLIFNGDGYSEFKEDNSLEDLRQADFSNSNSLLNSTESELSTNSIPSAEHDFSLSNIDNDLDFENALGIDDDANVNLKLQNRNLRKRASPLKSQPNPESLKILATPTKIIQIPDLTNRSSPKGIHSSLDFLDDIAPTRQTLEHDTLSPGKERDKLDLGFVFPQTSNKTNENDFLKIDSSPVTKEFEQRREKLVKLNSSSPKGKCHGHRRSRSIHQVDDIFAATSTPPKIPERSSRRLLSPGHLSPEVSSGSSSNTNINPPAPQDSQPSIKVISPDTSEESSSLYEENKFTQENSRMDPSKPHLDTDFKITGQKRSEQLSENSQSVDTIESDQSLEIISVRKITENTIKPIHNENSQDEGTSRVLRPLTSMNSFHRTIALPEEVTPSMNYSNGDFINLLSPRRSLSNIGSNSSHNSEFSKKSVQSAATSQPSDFGLKNEMSKKPEPSDQAELYSIYEKRDGKMVEVFVIDEERDQSLHIPSIGSLDYSHKRKTMSYQEASQNYLKILQMCEQTATQAKDIILQLIEDDPEPGKTIPSPVEGKSKAFTQFSPQRRTYNHVPTRLRVKNQRYLSKLDRAVKVRPFYEPSVVAPTKQPVSYLGAR